jgi:hypothetical protein
MSGLVDHDRPTTSALPSCRGARPCAPAVPTVTVRAMGQRADTGVRPYIAFSEYVGEHVPVLPLCRTGSGSSER